MSSTLIINSSAVRGEEYSRLLLQRDSYLSLSLEQIARDLIISDPSDYGVDLAVGKIFTGHRPSTHKWKHLQHANARWLRCKTDATIDQASQTIHFDLLDGAVRVNGQPLDELMHKIRGFAECQQIFRDVRTCADVSNIKMCP